MDYHKLISSISLAVTPALLVYAISGQGEIKEQVARVDAKVTATHELAKAVEMRELDLYSRTDDRYRRADAMEDFSRIDSRIDKIELSLVMCCGYEKAPN